jgi:hypothetical protein
LTAFGLHFRHARGFALAWLAASACGTMKLIALQPFAPPAPPPEYLLPIIAFRP